MDQFLFPFIIFYYHYFIILQHSNNKQKHGECITEINGSVKERETEKRGTRKGEKQGCLCV